MLFLHNIGAHLNKSSVLLSFVASLTIVTENE